MGWEPRWRSSPVDADATCVRGAGCGAGFHGAGAGARGVATAMEA